jgi:hypothetical protein
LRSQFFDKKFAGNRYWKSWMLTTARRRFFSLPEFYKDNKF